MRHTFGKVLIGFAVLASGAAGATLAVATAGSSAAAIPAASTAAVTSAAASGASTPAFPQGRPGRAFPMATTPTSTANCPNMGSHPRGGTPTATATPGS